MPIGETAPAMLDRYRRSAERRSENFADQSPSDRHELRIALKKMRYTTELFAGLYAERPVAEFTQRLKRLQDGLGTANDVHIAESLIHELGNSTPKGADIVTSGRQVLEWHKRRLIKGDKKIREDLRLLMETKPFWLL